MTPKFILIVYDMEDPHVIFFLVAIDQLGAWEMGLPAALGAAPMGGAQPKKVKQLGGHHDREPVGRVGRHTSQSRADGMGGVLRAWE